jgi:hypothetical protein
MRIPSTCIAAILALFPACTARATVIDVTSNSTSSNVMGACALRDAIMAVNSRSGVGGCAAGAGPIDTINLPGGQDFEFTERDANSHDAALPALIAGRQVNLHGKTTSKSPTIVATPAVCAPNGATDSYEFRLLEVRSGAVLFVDNVTFSNGCADGSEDFNTGAIGENAQGGAIFNAGILDLDHDGVFDSTAAIEGGGIYNASSGVLLINATSIESNVAGLRGGGMFSAEDGCSESYLACADIETSLFFDNKVNAALFSTASTAPSRPDIVVDFNYWGGAIENQGSMFLLNDTFAQNRIDSCTNGGLSTCRGNALHSRGYLALSFSTLSGNSGSGNSLDVDPGAGATQIASTLFADDYSATNSHSCGFGNGDSVTMTGVSFSRDATCGGGSNQTNTTVTFTTATPGVNGGPTETLVLAASSAAADADAACLDAYGAPVAADQRGFPRPYGPQCDAGAAEGPADFIFIDGFEIPI